MLHQTYLRLSCGELRLSPQPAYKCKDYNTRFVCATGTNAPTMTDTNESTAVRIRKTAKSQPQDMVPSQAYGLHLLFS